MVDGRFYFCGSRAHFYLMLCSQTEYLTSVFYLLLSNEDDIITLIFGSWSEVAQSCLTLCDPMACSLSGSSIHGIFQARVLEWVAISFSRVSSQLRDGNGSPPLQTETLPAEPSGKPIIPGRLLKKKNPGSYLQNFLFFSSCVEAKNLYFLKVPR